MVHRVCQAPTGFYLLGVALRSFFLVLATHLLAGNVDTTITGVPLIRRISWWCRYYNPLNLSWRYYSMFAYRFTAHSWGTHQLALINHEEHPLLPPLPYIVGETVHPLHVRRLEMAGILSSQGILTFSAAYQGALAIQYAISTEGIPYLPNITVPLAMVGLFRVMACKWVASKIHVDSYPYPCMPSTFFSQVGRSESNASTSSSSCFQGLCKSSIGSLWASSSNTSAKDSSSTLVSMIKPKGNLLSSSFPVTESQINSSSSFPTISRAHEDPSSMSVPIVKLHIDESPSPSIATFNTEFLSSSAFSNQMQSPASINMRYSQLPWLALSSSSYTAHPPSPQSPSQSVLQSPNRPLLPTISRPYSQSPSISHAMESMPSANVPTCNTGALPLKSSHPYTPLSKACLLPSTCSVSVVNHIKRHKNPSASSSSCTTLSSTSCSKLESSTCPQAPHISSPLSSEEPSQGHQMHVHPSSPSSEGPLPYKSNKIVVAGWIGVLVALVTMSFLPYKVAAAYQLPHRLLQFSMQIFYQYIAVTEFVFHGYLLYQGPRALANRVLFFDHWTFKAQTAGFFCLLMFMLVIALLDFVKHDFYRVCV